MAETKIILTAQKNGERSYTFEASRKIDQRALIRMGCATSMTEIFLTDAGVNGFFKSQFNSKAAEVRGVLDAGYSLTMGVGRNVAKTLMS